MKLVLGTNYLGLGGSESYLLTVAEQLDRLGHGVTIYTPEPGPGVAAALERGLEVVDQVGLPEECDAALVQDAGVSYQLAKRFPSTPQLFVAHSEIFDVQAPPQLSDAVGTVVVLNDRVANRVRAYGVPVEVVRLRQPIDTDRFLPSGKLPEVPRRALMLSNNSQADRFEMLKSACAEAGLELTQTGGAGGQVTDPSAALGEADIVIGYGRSVLEAMARGRAAYVYDWTGGDGWMTAESYPAIEADGIAGRSGRLTPDTAALVEDLRRYRAEMGPVNRDLVMAHHRANVHAQELIELIRDLAVPAPRERAPLEEMARLVRLEWRARGDVQKLTAENGHLRDLLAASEERVGQVEERARVREEHLRASYEQSRSWRVTAPMRAAGRAARRVRRNR